MDFDWCCWWRVFSILSRWWCVWVWRAKRRKVVLPLNRNFHSTAWRPTSEQWLAWSLQADSLRGSCWRMDYVISLFSFLRISSLCTCRNLADFHFNRLAGSPLFSGFAWCWPPFPAAGFRTRSVNELVLQLAWYSWVALYYSWSTFPLAFSGFTM